MYVAIIKKNYVKGNRFIIGYEVRFFTSHGVYISQSCPDIENAKHVAWKGLEHGVLANGDQARKIFSHRPKSQEELAEEVEHALSDGVPMPISVIVRASDIVSV